MERDIKEIIYINTIETNSITDKFDFAEYRNGGSMITVTHRYDGISDKHLRNALHAHSYYEFEFVYGGKGVQILSKSSFNMSRGCAYLRTPNNLHTTWQDVNDVLKSYNIRFTVDYIPKEIETYLMTAGNAVCVKFDEDELESLILKIEQLISEIKSLSPYVSLMVGALFSEILVAFIRKYHIIENQYSNNSRYVQYVINYINGNFRGELSVRELAEAVHLNPHYLGDIFKREMGKSISEYILDLKLILAVQLLMNSSMRINEISTECGFNTPTYFICKFRERYGISQMKYRNEKAADRLL